MTTNEITNQNFEPIYNLLYSDISKSPEKDKSLVSDEIKALISNISKLDRLGIDLVYVLIRIHSIRYSNSKIMDVPYGGSRTNKNVSSEDEICDIKFDIKKFPVILSRLLLHFTDLHLRRIDEEVNRST
jgi:hypothetical protein